jgi:hypothetical protein
MEDLVRGLALGMSGKPVSAAPFPDVASSIGFNCGLIAVLLTFLLPSDLLYLLGIDYAAPDSFAAFKIHPATYLTVFGLIATLLAVFQRKPVAGQAEWRVPAIFILLTVLCVLCSFLSVGTAGASNYVDTFVAAGALAMILATGDTRQRRKLGYLILALVLANVLLSFWESMADTHLVPLHINPSDLKKGAGREGLNFRPGGLYGHPLQAACVTSMGFFLLLAMRLGPWLSGVVFGLLAAGLFSFGGRGALFITFGTLVVAGVAFLLMTLARRALTPRILSYTLLAVLVLPPSLVLLTSETRIGTRIVSHFYVDDSARVRAQQWDILDLIDLQEVLYGTTREHVDLMANQIGLTSQGSGIENPWLLIFLNLGMINLIPFLVGLSMFLVYLARRGGWPLGWLLVCTYITIASTNNSLGVKTSDLSFLVAVVIAMSGFRNQTSAISSESKLNLELAPQPLRSGTSQSSQRGLSPNVAPDGNRLLLQR